MAKKKSGKAAPKRARKTSRSTIKSGASRSTGPSVSEMRVANSTFLKAFGVLGVIIILIALLYSVMPGLFSGFFGSQEVDFAYTDASENKYSFNSKAPFGTKVTDSSNDEDGTILPATLENSDFVMSFEALSESFESELKDVVELEGVKGFAGAFRVMNSESEAGDPMYLYGNKLYEDEKVCEGIGIALTENAFEAPCGDTALYLGNEPRDGMVYVSCVAKTENGLEMCDEVLKELRVEIVE